MLRQRRKARTIDDPRQHTRRVTTIMTQSREPNDRDILTRIATLEYQMTEIQNVQAQLRATIAPGGYITDGFEQVVNQLRSEIQESEGRLNAKLDILIRGMTGMSQE
jgi:translation initiation factor 1 (eIF-1/SUI1)